MDTAAKRFSAINLGSPWRGCAIVPSGSVGAGERQAAAFLYSGILAQAQQSVATYYVDDAPLDEKPRKSRRREREEVLEDVRAALEGKKGFFQSAKAARAERVAVSLAETSTSDVAAALAFAKAEPSEDAKAIKALLVELRRREIEEDDAEVEMLLRALN